MPTKAQIKARKKFLKEHDAFFKKWNRNMEKLRKKGKARLKK